MESYFKTKVSIIVPIYGVENYILTCLRSIDKQTFQNIECILVNDCTKDRSMELVDIFLKDESTRPSIYRIINHAYNRGLSSARNTGVKHANGNYIYFLDSDDYISANCIQGMVNSAIEFNADIVWGGINRIYDNRTHAYNPLYSENRVYNRCEILQMYSSQVLYTEAVNKLIKKNYLTDNGVQFVDGMLHEDINWTFYLLAFPFKGAFYDKPTYAYIQRSGSIMSKLTNKNYYAQIENLRLIDKIIKDFQLNDDLDYLNYYQYMIDYSIWMLFYRKTTIKERYQLYKKLRNTQIDFYKVLQKTKQVINISNYHFCISNNNLAYVCFEFQNTIRRIKGRIDQLWILF